MNHTVIEEQARYLIEDRIRQTRQAAAHRRTPPAPEGPQAELAVTLSHSRLRGSRSQQSCGRLPAVSVVEPVGTIAPPGLRCR